MHTHKQDSQFPTIGDGKLFSTSPKWWRKLWGWRKAQVPLLYQMNATECGAACLAMILNYYGFKTSVSEVGERCGVSRDGLSALSIVKAARSYDLRVRAVSLPENDFRFVLFPCIVHWNFNHFLIVERWSRTRVKVIDPAVGRRSLSSQEFNAGFTGVTILLEPGVNFLQRTTASPKNWRSYLVNYMRQAPLAFAQVLVASLVLQVLGLAVPILTKVLIDQIIPLHMNEMLSLLGVGLLLVLLSRAVVTLLRSALLVYLQVRIDTRMMLSFFEHLLSLPLCFFQRRSSGDILSRLASNSVIRDTLSNQFNTTLLDGSFVAVYLFLLLGLSLPLGLLVLSIGLFQGALLLSTQHRLREFSSRELIAQARTYSYATEVLMGIETVKAAGAEHHTFHHWANLLFDQLNTSVRRNSLLSLVDSLVNLLQICSLLILLWVGAFQVLNGSMQIGTMLAFSALASAFLTPLASVINNAQKLHLVRSHLERILDVMENEPEQQTYQVRLPPILTGKISLKDVSFGYDIHTPPILSHIQIEIEVKQKVAIVGRTGSGKSTLGRLLLGLYLPLEGEILYDDIPLRSLNYQAIRTQFGIVTQDSRVFAGSIRQNIAFHNPTMTIEQVSKAAQAAGLHDDIQRLPLGYETFVSEQGSDLSSGQRQRLALARALAHCPTVLLLDEATSHLDVETEKLVAQNLNALACTQIIIAHRLSTIRHADLILVLDQGTIVESGSHSELLALNGYYAKLMQRQVWS